MCTYDGNLNVNTQQTAQIPPHMSLYQRPVTHIRVQQSLGAQCLFQPEVNRNIALQLHNAHRFNCHKHSTLLQKYHTSDSCTCCIINTSTHAKYLKNVKKAVKYFLINFIYLIRQLCAELNKKIWCLYHHYYYWYMKTATCPVPGVYFSTSS